MAKTLSTHKTLTQPLGSRPIYPRLGPDKIASAVQASPAEDTDILSTLTEIGSPPPDNPPPLDRGLNDSVYANLNNLVREKTVTFIPVPGLSPTPEIPTTTIGITPTTTVTTATPVSILTIFSAATTTLALPLRKRNNIPSLLNTVNNLYEQVKSTEISK